jgi:hypothetical protein
MKYVLTFHCPDAQSLLPYTPTVFSHLHVSPYLCWRSRHHRQTFSYQCWTFGLVHDLALPFRVAPVVR